jgi:hypothetical protein
MRTYLFRKVLPGGLTIVEVVLDAKIFPGPARIVTCREHNRSLAVGQRANGGTDRGRRHDGSVGGYQDGRHAIGRQDVANDRDRLGVVVAPIPGNDDSAEVYYVDTGQGQKSNQW